MDTGSGFSSEKRKEKPILYLSHYPCTGILPQTGVSKVHEVALKTHFFLEKTQSHAFGKDSVTHVHTAEVNNGWKLMKLFAADPATQGNPEGDPRHYPGSPWRGRKLSLGHVVARSIGPRPELARATQENLVGRPRGRPPSLGGAAISRATQDLRKRRRSLLLFSFS